MYYECFINSVQVVVFPADRSRPGRLNYPDLGGPVATPDGNDESWRGGGNGEPSGVSPLPPGELRQNGLEQRYITCDVLLV